ncbi:hypothetical protein VC81_12690 [Levilactobacillus spicheri]|uniref:Glycosyl transferase family 1 domain-containing protein n=2 Tax=Levilactobacillus spicheri TaxID=216463 RepID=A0A0F3RNR5_9LACO|nr:hypothetical protein VC81_12690 [Levilactobacillus spicheri]
MKYVEGKERKLHKSINILNVARCDYQKNPEKFIKIADIVTNSLPNVHFTWIGDGPDLEKCRNLVKSLNLTDQVKFEGYSECVEKYLKNADIFLSTSRYEGLPFSVLEALSCGLPLLLTNIIGHNSLIDHNGFFLISEKEIIFQIEYILSHRKKLSERSLTLYHKNYSVEGMIFGIEKVYREVVLSV